MDSLAQLAAADLPAGTRLRHAARVAQLAAQRDTELRAEIAATEGVARPDSADTVAQQAHSIAALYLAAAGALGHAANDMRESGENAGMSAHDAEEKAKSYRNRASELMRDSSREKNEKKGKRERRQAAADELVDEGDGAYVMTAPPAVDWSSLQAQEKQSSSLNLNSEATSSSSGTLFRVLDEAMAATDAAHVAEKQHNFELALREYHRACSALLSALEQEQNEDTKAHIRSKVTINMERAELIKAHVQRKSISAAGGMSRGSQDSTTRIRHVSNAGGSSPALSLQRQQASAAAAAQVPPPTPEPIEVNEQSAPFVSAGLAAVQAAKVADTNDDLSTAIAKYEEAVDSFTRALAVEKNTKSRKLLNDHTVGCFQRAERLKAILTSGSAVAASRIIPMGIKASEADNTDKKNKKNKKGSTYEEPKIRAIKGGKKTWGKF